MLYPLFVTGEVSPLETLFHGDVHTHSPISTKCNIFKSNRYHREIKNVMQ